MSIKRHVAICFLAVLVLLGTVMPVSSARQPEPNGRIMLDASGGADTNMQFKNFKTKGLVIERGKDKKGNTALLVQTKSGNFTINQAYLLTDDSLSDFAVWSNLEISYMAFSETSTVKWITKISRITEKAPNPFSGLNAANIKEITCSASDMGGRGSDARIRDKQDIQEIVRLLQSVDFVEDYLGGALEVYHYIGVALNDGSKKKFAISDSGLMDNVRVSNYEQFQIAFIKIDAIQMRSPRISWLNGKLKPGKSAPGVDALEITKDEEFYKNITKTEDMQRLLDAMRYPYPLYWSDESYYRDGELLTSVTVGGYGAFSIYKYQGKYYIYKHSSYNSSAEGYPADAAWAENLVSMYDKLNYPAEKIDDEPPDAWWGNDALTGKPVIYLYPEKTQDVSVKLDFNGEVSYTYPTYNNGWNVTAAPDGTLTNKSDGSTHYYLFWDGNAYFNDWDFSTGFVVKGSEVQGFFEDKLPEMGLTPREYNDFITYWVPRLAPNAYNLITFATTQYEAIAPLDITPKPDTMLRVHMVYKPISAPVAVKEQALPKAPERKGFTVVEWGATRAR